MPVSHAMWRRCRLVETRYDMARWRGRYAAGTPWRHAGSVYMNAKMFRQRRAHAVAYIALRVAMVDGGVRSVVAVCRCAKTALVEVYAVQGRQERRQGEKERVAEQKGSAGSSSGQAG